MLARIIHATGVVLVTLSGVQAQTLSPAEIRSMVNERASGLNEYQTLLNDPDPLRSIAAMQIMMESGDPDLERMAMDYGLFSSEPAVRRAPLEAFFNASPTLELWIDGSGLEDDQERERFKSSDLVPLGGSVSGDGRGFLSLKVGDYDPKNACWILQDSRSKGCLVRLSEDSVSIYLYNKWHNLTLSDGTLVGDIVPAWVPKPLPASISVTR